MRLAVSASNCRSFMVTPFFLVQVVLFLVMLLTILTNHARASITQSTWLSIRWVIFLCRKVTVADSHLAFVSFMNMLCVR